MLVDKYSNEWLKHNIYNYNVVYEYNNSKVFFLYNKFYIY